MDTIGSLIDKLVTVRLKQSFTTYMTTDEEREDLGRQAEKLVQEIDAKLGEMVAVARAGGQLDDGAFVQRKHKTY